MAGRDILTAEQIKSIVKEAVHDAFHDAGLLMSDEKDVMEVRKDFLFLRSIRQRLDGAANKIGTAVILAIVSGIIGLVWQGFKLMAVK